VIHPEDVLTTKSLANLLVAQTTNVTHLPTNAKLLFQAAAMVIHAPPIPSTHLLAAFILQNALLQMHVPQLLALTDNALPLQRIVMTEMFAPSTLAILDPEPVSTPQSLAHAVPETLELAILQLQSVKSENLVLTTVIAQLMETQHTLLSVTQKLDVLMSLISKF